MNHLILNDKKEFKFDERKSIIIKKKKTSYEQKRPRFSKPFNVQRRKITTQSTNSNKNLMKKMTHNNFEETYPKINPGIYFKEIEQEIKYNLLEMKDECIQELKIQSCDNLELFKELNVESNKNVGIFNNKINSISGGLNKEKRKKTYKKSKTNVLDINNKNKKKIIKKKKSKSKSKSIHENIIKRFSKLKDKSAIPRRYLSSGYIKPNNIKRQSMPGDKFRFYSRGGLIEDSFDENESEEEQDNYLINPETTIFFIYDTIICIAAIYSLINNPYEIISEYLCDEIKKNFKPCINFLVDILFMNDLIINFFLQYYNHQEKLIKNRRKIISKYLRGHFWFDLVTSLPTNIMYYYYKKNSFKICHTFEKSNFIYYLSILKCLKSIKVFKITGNKKNQLIARLLEKVPDSWSNTLNLITQISLIIFGLHILSCIHIYIGQNTYPGWIFSNNFENFSTLNLYMISFYYLITTMTTVGYGDISSDSFIEIIFRIILLSVGIICYSWLISNISNRINKQSYASINFENDSQILENIRKEHRDLPYGVYNEIKKHLEYKHFHQQIYDKNLLINNLPFALKNNLIFSMYSEELKKFNYFKGISNTSFLSEILYNFYPIMYKKNDIILEENEIIEEIFFVREGRLSLEIPIDMSDPEKSANDILSKDFMNFAFNFEENNTPYIIGTNITNHSISSLFEQKEHSLISEKFKTEIVKKNMEHNIFYLKIYDIHKNEDYGAVHLFHGKRTPFAVKVKSKRVLLYTIKNEEYSNICYTYKNVIKRINRKEKKIIKLIKNVLIKTIDKFCKSNEIDIKEEYLEEIEEAINELKTKMIPDILKNSSVGSSNNEIDNEINETVRQFNINVMRVTSIKPIPQNGIIFGRIKKEQIKETRIPKRSFNFEGNLGASIIKGFKPKYYENYKSSKKLSNINTDYINKLLYKSIIEKKNKLSLQMDKNKMSNKNIKNIVKNYNDSNSKSSSSLKNIDFNFPDTNSDKSNITEKTIKIKKEENEDEDESIESGPKTINILPKSLQTSLKDKIKNCQKLSLNYGNFKIERISIEINNNLYKKNNSKNNYIFSNIGNQSNNRSYGDIAKEQGLITSGTYSDINNSMNTKNKNMNPNSGRIPLKMKLKVLKKNKKMKESTKTSSRLTISPNFSSYNISSIIKNNNLSPSLKHHKEMAFSNNNISPKFDETLIYNNNKLEYDNMSSTSADSFEIKSSYKNLNQISKGAYIKDKILQKNIIKFIKTYEKEKKNKKSKNINFHAFMKGNKDEDHFKRIENEIHSAKTKITKYLLKKNKNVEKINNIKSLKVTLKNRLKNGIKNNRISANHFDFNNSSIIELNANSLTVNPDDTLAKLNCNEAIKSEIKEDSKMKKKNKLLIASEKKN